MAASTPLLDALLQCETDKPPLQALRTLAPDVPERLLVASSLESAPLRLAPRCVEPLRLGPLSHLLPYI